MKTKILKLHPDAVVPRYETAGAMAFDLTSIDNCMIWPNKVRVVDTGIAIEPPEGYALVLNLRSSSSKGQLALANMQGWIDPDYRGSLKVALRNVGDQAQAVQRGERIAQAMIVPVFRTDFEVVDQLSTTARGDGAYGSTGTGLDDAALNERKSQWGKELGEASPSRLNERFRKTMYVCRNCSTSIDLHWYHGTQTPVCALPACTRALDAQHLA